MTKIELFQFIASQNLAVLSSLSPKNFPQSALIGIAVTQSLEILFDTLASSRKYPNLIANPAASLVIGWHGEITVQYEGQARQLQGSELAKYIEIYFAKWPECRAHQSWPGISYFLVTPKWIRYSDYGQQTPLIQEFTF